MSHLDPEKLALLALGEPVASPVEREHLSTCPDCAADLAEMSHAVGVARSTIDESELETPPPRVWHAIAEELSLASDPGDAGPVAPEAVDAVAGPRDRRRRRDRRVRPRRAAWVLVASLALVVAVGAGTWVGLAALAPVPVATAALESFPDHAGASGTAEVEESRDGRRTLLVELDGVSESEDYREVWLIRSDGTSLISLGVLDGPSGSFAIPPEVDLAEYDLVDVSFEPIGGEPGHSGDSIVRGQLTSA